MMVSRSADFGSWMTDRSYVISKISEMGDGNKD